MKVKIFSLVQFHPEGSRDRWTTEFLFEQIYKTLAEEGGIEKNKTQICEKNLVGFLTTAGKGIILLMRAVGLNATTFPGKITYRFGKHLPEYLTSGQHVTLITGTNGKTTTAKNVVFVYEKAGYKVISNVSGANLISGIITTLIEHRSIYGTDTRIVLEIDEAAFGRYSGVLNPSCIAVTNLFRDQLDRYGELTRTRDLIRKGIGQAGEVASFCVQMIFLLLRFS
jgi:UDP-N-acetylmuramyl tripeptide synthase